MKQNPISSSLVFKNIVPLTTPRELFINNHQIHTRCSICWLTFSRAHHRTQQEAGCGWHVSNKFPHRIYLARNESENGATKKGWFYKLMASTGNTMYINSTGFWNKTRKLLISSKALKNIHQESSTFWYFLFPDSNLENCINCAISPPSIPFKR